MKKKIFLLGGEKIAASLRIFLGKSTCTIVGLASWEWFEEFDKVNAYNFKCINLNFLKQS